LAAATHRKSLCWSDDIHYLLPPLAFLNTT